ncbi:hypothetical protein E2542_SST01150 [Spatholobus suberectus]|nr:hypothetical protein E2542_SST01150 [Spatholobus suberectus]
MKSTLLSFVPLMPSLMIANAVPGSEFGIHIDLGWKKEELVPKRLMRANDGAQVPLSVLSPSPPTPTPTPTPTPPPSSSSSMASAKTPPIACLGKSHRGFHFVVTTYPS